MLFMGIGRLDNRSKKNDEKQNDACQFKGVKENFRPFNFLAGRAIRYFAGLAVMIKVVGNYGSVKNYRKGYARRYSEKYEFSFRL